MIKAGYVYILASAKYGTLYVGVTSDLVKRIWQHREGVVEGFTMTHDIKRLVYVEQVDTIGAAIAREKVLKKWRLQWKIDAIENANPEWRDLYDKIVL